MQLPDDIILKLILSVIIGGLIGAEREYRSKSAGFRTLTMICLGATLFTIFSELIGGPKGTPDRIASNVVVGIGFVGAGVIFKGDSRVNGITTAALIWVTAALGMSIGAGYTLVAISACLLILAVLYLFTLVENWIDRISQIRDYKIVCDYQNDILRRYETLFVQHHLRFKRSRQSKEGDVITGEWIVKGSEKNHRHFVYEILNDKNVKAFDF
ncbi:MAG TPA: MgtC/SapB family protein [Puia sp.]|nr:MgtC/SapB family protein [Puia sp.]